MDVPSVTNPSTTAPSVAFDALETSSKGKLSKNRLTNAATYLSSQSFPKKQNRGKTKVGELDTIEIEKICALNLEKPINEAFRLDFILFSSEWDSSLEVVLSKWLYYTDMTAQAMLCQLS